MTSISARSRRGNAAPQLRATAAIARTVAQSPCDRAIGGAVLPQRSSAASLDVGSRDPRKRGLRDLRG
jgi:hypothetical protein